MTTKQSKASYTIPCSSSFRDKVCALAEARRVNVADLARSILLAVPDTAIQQVQDPGGPMSGDREVTVLKSGPSAGKPWRRKPRLQVRLSPGYNISTVRKALNLALQLDQKSLVINIENPTTMPDPPKPPLALLEKVDRLQEIVFQLMFNPLEKGVNTRADAMHVMGFGPSEHPDKNLIRSRFRSLATIYHPDSNYGNHQHMSQLNAAMELLNR